MADKRTYWEKLKDPQWQKRRLQILERDEWMCQRCGDFTSTLHVHHGFYKKGVEPWDYPEYSLHSLCEECHKIIQAEVSELHQFIGELPVDILFDIRPLLEAFIKDYPFAKLVVPPGSPVPYILETEC